MTFCVEWDVKPLLDQSSCDCGHWHVTLSCELHLDGASLNEHVSCLGQI